MHRIDIPEGTRGAGMYFRDRDAPLRAKNSLLLKDNTPHFVSRLAIICINIKSDRS